MNTASGLPPSITVSTFDMDRLDAMLESPANSQTPAARALADELNRATVLRSTDRCDATRQKRTTIQPS